MILKKILYRLRLYKISLINNFCWNSFGKHSRVIKPMRIIGKKFISIGFDSIIMNDARIEAVYNYGDEVYFPSIKIGDNVDIQQRVHITCAESINICNNVSILPDVLITDINHPYIDISIPPKNQHLEHKPVFIGEETIVGMGARILPGVKIGKHCCIGANSVVTQDIPDYSVAVGIPAKVVKRYDFDESEWINVSRDKKLIVTGGG
ncbi:acyltransferase [uncultured Treponema sp.]|uniref:acyltransferase n=1 Tax=uncultured Treponema sp. TaxID=162155 RepID=UPI0025D7483F|nr:acyltransferase [uncultured Treponema sp.]